MATVPEMAGLVLCGGASRRMGADKAFLEVGGQSLLHRVAQRLATAADPVLLATGTPGRLGSLPWPEVADAGTAPGGGPLAGVVAGLRASPHPVMAVVAVDLPFVSVELLGWLLSRWRGQPALVPLDAQGRPQPLHAVYAAATIDDLEGRLLAGQRRVLDVLQAVGAAFIEAPALDEGDLWSLNVNHPDDLEVVRRRLD